jgi:ethanolamine ammonia-lyase small subunit
MKKPADLSASNYLIKDSWSSLRRYTDARIALGRSGVSLPTAPQLAFAQDHASARDAVHIPLDVIALQESLQQFKLQSMVLHSQAEDRTTYLQRPDKGRRLDPSSASLLKVWAAEHQPCDASVVIVDGLSSTGVQRHAAELSKSIEQALNQTGLSCSPHCIVEQGRVAIGDEIGELLGVKLMILLVGERPGLSSPDSLGIYFTFKPRVGLSDANRNCISNIRPAGMQTIEAVERLLWLVHEAMRVGKSGVMLKDRSGNSDEIEGHIQQNFLLE